MGVYKKWSSEKDSFHCIVGFVGSSVFGAHPTLNKSQDILSSDAKILIFCISSLLQSGFFRLSKQFEAFRALDKSKRAFLQAFSKRCCEPVLLI